MNKPEELIERLRQQLKMVEWEMAGLKSQLAAAQGSLYSLSVFLEEGDDVHETPYEASKPFGQSWPAPPTNDMG